MNNHGIPILGNSQKYKTPMSGFAAIARDLDENGLVECEGTQMGPNGEVIGVVSRDSYMDATELLDHIRLIVREEVARALAVHGAIAVAEKMKNGR